MRMPTVTPAVAARSGRQIIIDQAGSSVRVTGRSDGARARAAPRCEWPLGCGPAAHICRR